WLIWKRSYPERVDLTLRCLSSARLRSRRMRSREKRVRTIELSLTPQQVAVLWLRNAQQAGTFEEGAQHSPPYRGAVAKRGLAHRAKRDERSAGTVCRASRDPSSSGSGFTIQPC